MPITYNRLQKEIEALKETIQDQAHVINELSAKKNALQAQIDALMLEYCPQDMTTEQFDNWKDYQRPVEET